MNHEIEFDGQTLVIDHQIMAIRDGDFMTELLPHDNDEVNELTLKIIGGFNSTVLYTPYRESVKIHGKVGCSELGMHCGIAENHGILALCQPGRRDYAFVLTDDGRWTQGVLHIFDDGTFSLS